MKAIYDQWVVISNTDPSTLSPIPIELGKGNEVKFNQSTMNEDSYPSDNVMLQNPGLESQEDLFDSDDDDDKLVIAANLKNQ